jgi:hypothetical protein
MFWVDKQDMGDVMEEMCSKRSNQFNFLGTKNPPRYQISTCVVKDNHDEYYEEIFHYAKLN